jgi:hypothetical protein
MKKITLKRTMTRLERIKTTKIQNVAGRGNAAGIHADQNSRYSKRQRALNRQEERNAGRIDFEPQ